MFLLISDEYERIYRVTKSSQLFKASSASSSDLASAARCLLSPADNRAEFIRRQDKRLFGKTVDEHLLHRLVLLRIVLDHLHCHLDKTVLAFFFMRVSACFIVSSSSFCQSLIISKSCRLLHGSSLP